MKLFIHLFLITILFTLTNCENSSQDTNSSNQIEKKSPASEIEKSPEELRAELKASEENSPLEYLSCEDVKMSEQTIQTRSEGLFRDAEYEPDGAIFTGNIHNKATLGQFKDAKIKILFYSRTNSLIEEKTYTIYEYLEPNSSISFSFKIESYPQAYSTFQVQLISAKVAE
ncbi:hypothetical protein [Fluviicola taffensis]|uniref:Uncharacterized protein n=1 Tax=Fluviicola taffensis (strain DSM 16823 / NCIMB 13979 / RW262) TaxID=755732 RepID=F2ICH6_FLUTR|nr:hypothetical protein [Fluviicola taffensis]AEA45446.1 hypothetical protein Fluta_3475 [Fluviicola taffensis DSM 16823]